MIPVGHVPETGVRVASAVTLKPRQVTPRPFLSVPRLCQNLTMFAIEIDSLSLRSWLFFNQH